MYSLMELNFNIVEFEGYSNQSPNEQLHHNPVGFILVLHILSCYYNKRESSGWRATKSVNSGLN